MSIKQDCDIISAETESIVLYILNELEHEIKGSYIIESTPELETAVYQKLRIVLKNKIKLLNNRGVVNVQV